MNKQCSVVVVGGGFCGTMVASRLERDSRFRVTLVTPRPHFEFTPSVPKLIANPAYGRRIRVPFVGMLKRTHVCAGTATNVDADSVLVGDRRIPFDYLVMATGCGYPVRLADRRNVFTVHRGEDAERMAEGLPGAASVLVVGGGLVGVEVAAELATKSPGRRVSLVHPHDRLMDRHAKRASHHAERFLVPRGVTIVYGERVVERDGNRFLTDTGRAIQADMAVWSTGVRPATEFLESFITGGGSARGALAVDAGLRLVGHENIFAGGDVTNVPEEKTAQNAQRHARVIVRNIHRHLRGQPAVVYRPRTGPLVISLGDATGILTFKDLAWGGRMPGALKWAIEWMELARYGGILPQPTLADVPRQTPKEIRSVKSASA